MKTYEDTVEQITSYLSLIYDPHSCVNKAYLEDKIRGMCEIVAYIYKDERSIIASDVYNYAFAKLPDELFETAN